MTILVTAGNTQAMIDRVRCITNIFSGRTGCRIALAAHDRGHRVVLLTSHPATAAELPHTRPLESPSWELQTYRTFEELDEAMARNIRSGAFDVVIHSAAVSDYRVTGTYSRDGETFRDVSAGKVRSTHPELWLRMEPAPKLIDKVRRNWAFAGKLVKFKLEVGATEEELLAIAVRSRTQSAADFIVANTLEGMEDWAIIDSAGGHRRVPRPDLPGILLDLLASPGA